MPLLNKIKTKSSRIAQLEPGTGNNQPARASDVNPILDWINNRSDVNTALNVVTTTGNTTVQAATINAISGTITTVATATAAGPSVAITVTNAFCRANSTVLCQIVAANITGGTTIIQSVVPSNGSFVINLSNPTVISGGTQTFVIKFIIL